jgi:hypothetical protein
VVGDEGGGYIAVDQRVISEPVDRAALRTDVTEGMLRR